MPSMLGTTVRVSVFGQSHSPAIGCVIEGLPSGFPVDLDALAHLMARRAPGQGPWATTRHEADTPRIVSGLDREGLTCGAPLAAVIENTDTRSQDYAQVASVPRPGHADLVAQAKWHGAQDVAGGGHFSGRLTAPLCVAGGICLQMLEARGVRVAAHLSSVAGVVDEPLSWRELTPDSQDRLARQMTVLSEAAFPVLDESAGERMREAIEAARKDADSVGGTIECVASGMPCGVGSPMADGIENLLSRAAFAIPAVKAIEFGAGFEAAGMRGSAHNDPYVPSPSGPLPAKNDAGGILGGITTGAPIRFRVAVKPTASIGREQDSVDLRTGEACRLAVHGRHDPCIAPRAAPVVEAVCALTLLDALLTWPADPDRHTDAEPASCEG
ncbi:MAG: chorismate synthase [Atopobiaceae bacterium]|nr:chorismate synthase [Atopobiaceae bacterium]MCH4180084.1 chorismate synthase [Atopobiaceae bacterium]MCH4213864.1 chorismate synthase [Atopobiaceae bacterium]MCH4229966.1 chorismate synthase [Atopobiaceae bacterium]MCH4275673.1 chorismate synthase [Atopobiaceae bacterium]